MRRRSPSGAAGAAPGVPRPRSADRAMTRSRTRSRRSNNRMRKVMRESRPVSRSWTRRATSAAVNVWGAVRAAGLVRTSRETMSVRSGNISQSGEQRPDVLGDGHGSRRGVVVHHLDAARSGDGSSAIVHDLVLVREAGPPHCRQEDAHLDDVSEPYVQPVREDGGHLRPRIAGYNHGVPEISDRAETFTDAERARLAPYFTN